MKHELVELKETGSFSGFFLDYLSQVDQLKPFYNNYPDQEGFSRQIQDRHFPMENRKVLVSVLQKQYEGLEITDKVSENIKALQDENTFTVTTGHQLNIFTGPLYVIYKLVTILRTCDELARQHPDKKFIPVYWMASEDHDFAEINHFHFNGLTYRWNSDQKGAVGRFSISDMKPLLDTLTAVPSLFHRAYQGKKTLAKAVREYLNELFGKYGLVILDADNHELKCLLRETMKKDIIGHEFEPIVASTTAKLESCGYNTQIHPRKINFFYLADNGRFRIEQDGEVFSLVDGDQTFTREEIIESIEQTPEKFSPNVVLRPFYQELILPNISYVGGPSELVYWLQLKDLFEKENVSFPILQPRNFALIIPAHVERKRESTGIEISDFFTDIDLLLTTKITDHSDKELSLDSEEEAISAIFDEIYKRACSIDPTLGQHVEAQEAKTRKVLQGIEKKFIRGEKRNHADLERQIRSVYDAIHPSGSLQERYENFLNYYQNDPNFIDKLMDAFDPLDFRFNIFTYAK